MPKLIIDEREIEVERGIKIIEAAERLGIMIPRLCYHWILGSVGACRLCAVKLLHKEFKGVQMSCMIDAQDGMIVSTTHPEAVQFRRRVIEWLMLNHPHDCPVCDEGGHCLLQDMTVSAGHGIRRYRGRKRTYRDQYLGPLVQHEMNRCIHCYRCSRFYQDFSGYRDLGAMQIADRVYFGRHTEGALESPFSGNLIDVCPTGVYTDRPARYNYRRWEIQRSPSLCIHCSMVCPTIANARYREVIRQEAPVDELDRGFFICDRGRFGFHFTNLPERPRNPRVDGEDVTWDVALGSAGERLRRIAAESGPSSIASFGSARCSLETQAALKRLCRLSQWLEPAWFPDPATAVKTRDAVSNLDETLSMSMRDIEEADFVLAIGADALNESPVLALSMRQARRNGATIAVVDPRPISLPFEFHHLNVGLSQVETCLGALVRGGLERGDVERQGSGGLDFFDAIEAGDSLDDAVKETLPGLASELRRSRKPVLICGTDIVSEGTPAFAGACARLLLGAKGSAGLLYILREANSFGAAISSGANTFLDVVQGIERGAIKGLVVVENDPFRSFPDRERLEQAVSRLEVLVVMDYLPTETVNRASVFLPASTLFETGSTFLSHEGRVRFAHPVHLGGAPLHQVSGGGHPPRVFERGIPGADSRPSWQILLDLGSSLSTINAPPPGTAGELIALEIPGLAHVGKDYPLDGKPVIPARSGVVSFAARAKPSAPGRVNELDLLLVDWTFGTEELAGYSPVLMEVEPEPVLFIHPDDAAAAAIREGDRALVRLDCGPLAVSVKVSSKMARGTAVLPRHRKLAWQRIKELPARIPLSRIERLSH